MKNLLRRYLEFNHWANSQYIQSISNDGITNDKIHWWMSHNLNAQHTWQCRLQNKATKYKVFQVHPMNDWQAIEDDIYQEGLHLLDTIDLDQDFNYQSTSGTKYQDKVKDVFLHFVDHSSYHRGQIAAKYRELGLEPLRTNFIHWTRTQV
ncbi:MAG: hypothetical protein KTR13_00570 [Saprospiraceae bacterium]|nr:hypothetical protein [Saprospiraceae bacterium]